VHSLAGGFLQRLWRGLVRPIRTFGDGKQPLREIFVSPTGSHFTGNGTQANPFQTIIRACKGFSP